MAVASIANEIISLIHRFGKEKMEKEFVEIFELIKDRKLCKREKDDFCMVVPTLYYILVLIQSTGTKFKRCQEVENFFNYEENVQDMKQSEKVRALENITVFVKFLETKVEAIFDASSDDEEYKIVSEMFR